jgi:hypothetical protein
VVTRRRGPRRPTSTADPIRNRGSDSRPVTARCSVGDCRTTRASR